MHAEAFPGQPSSASALSPASSRWLKMESLKTLPNVIPITTIEVGMDPHCLPCLCAKSNLTPNTRFLNLQECHIFPCPGTGQSVPFPVSHSNPPAHILLENNWRHWQCQQQSTMAMECQTNLSWILITPLCQNSHCPQSKGIFRLLPPCL